MALNIVRTMEFPLNMICESFPLIYLMEAYTSRTFALHPALCLYYAKNFTLSLFYSPSSPIVIIGNTKFILTTHAVLTLHASVHKFSRIC